MIRRIAFGLVSGLAAVSLASLGLGVSMRADATKIIFWPTGGGPGNPAEGDTIEVSGTSCPRQDVVNLTEARGHREMELLDPVLERPREARAVGRHDGGVRPRGGDAVPAGVRRAAPSSVSGSSWRSRMTTGGGERSRNKSVCER